MAEAGLNTPSDPHKGVDVYGYLSRNFTSSTPLYKYWYNKVAKQPSDPGTYSAHIEIDSDETHGLPGSVQLDVYGSSTSTNILFSRTNWISPSASGELQPGSQVTNLPQMASAFFSQGNQVGIATFGFYEAGTGMFGLPNSHRFWLTLTPDYSTWMGSIAPVKSLEAAQPFNTFVLPSAHDAGMNSSANAMALLYGSPDLAAVMALLIGVLPVIGPGLTGIVAATMLAEKADDIITALAITQKDTLTSMLRIGARYFEFRPAHISSYFDNPSKLPDKLYYTHWAIPGQSFDSWLIEAVAFLKANPTEIVVVQVRHDGIHPSCKFATPTEVDSYVSAALLDSSIVRGGLDDMKLSIDALRTANKRLIVLTEVGQYSTYGGGNATLDGDTIVQKFVTFLAQASTGEANQQIAVWQCQATSTSIPDVAVYCATFAKGATSSLLCTKAACDMKTLPWLEQNVYPTMPTTILQVIMNDFFDGHTSEVAIELSRKYLQRSIKENST